MIATAENNDTRSRRARADKLQIAFNLALQATLSKLNQRNLETCFPKLARDIPEQLEAVREQTVEFIESAAKEEFDIIMDKRNVMAKMNQFDEIIEKGTRSSQEDGSAGNNAETVSHAWLEPEVSVYSRLLQMKRAQLAELETLLSQAETENESLVTRFESRQKERNEAIAAISSLQAELSTSSNVLSSLV